MRTKKTLAKKLKQNRPIPQWIRMRTGNTIRYAPPRPPSRPLPAPGTSGRCSGFGGSGGAPLSLAWGRLPLRISATRGWGGRVWWGRKAEPRPPPPPIASSLASASHAWPVSPWARARGSPRSRALCSAQLQREAAPLASHQDRPVSRRRRCAGASSAACVCGWDRRTHTWTVKRFAACEPSELCPALFVCLPRLEFDRVSSST